MKKNLIWLIVLLGALALLGYVGYTIFSPKTNTNVGEEQNTQSGNGFNLSYVYKGDNLWEYSVDGTLPTPCYAVTTKAEVAESYPEQVTIHVAIEEQPAEGVCSTVIEEYTYTGTFNASEKATVNFIVE